MVVRSAATEKDSDEDQGGGHCRRTGNQGDPPTSAGPLPERVTGTRSRPDLPGQCHRLSQRQSELLGVGHGLVLSAVPPAGTVARSAVIAREASVLTVLVDTPMAAAISASGQSSW